MKENRNNSVKRTIAGILAVMTMVTATVPVMVRADEAPLDITTVMTESLESVEETETQAFIETPAETETTAETDADTEEDFMIARISPFDDVFAMYDDDFDMVCLKSSEPLESLGKKVGISVGNAALDTLGKAFPGANILVAPLKTLFGEATADPNPMTLISNKLEQMDNKLDALDSKLTELNQSIETNTKWMENVVENENSMSELRSEFKALSPVVAKFVKDVKAVEDNPEYSTHEKIMRLAALTDSSRYDAMTTHIFNIQKHMDGNSVIYANLYETLYQNKARNCMFAREAYQEAMPAAEALTEQYVFAVLLMAECQTASQAVCQFTIDDVQQMDEEEIEMFKKFDKFRHAMDDDDPSAALDSAANGAKAFQRHDVPNFINKNATTEGRAIEIGCALGRAYRNNDKGTLDIKGNVKASALSISEIKALAEHLRTKYNQTKSIYDFLIDDMKLPNVYDCECTEWDGDYHQRSLSNSNVYTITQENFNDDRTRNKSRDNEGCSWYNDPMYAYDHVVTTKGINIHDPKCEETTIKLYTYTSWDHYYIFGTDKDYAKEDFSYYLVCMTTFQNA